MLRSLLVLPLAAVAFAGCGLEDDGQTMTQNRDTDAFTRVANEGSLDVTVHSGATRRVSVRAGEKVIGDVRTEVRDGTLHVDFDHHGWGGNSAAVEVWMPELTAITAGGSGDIKADGIAADALTVASDGSADLRLSGRAARLAVDLDGSGDADLAGLSARSADVSVSGSGDAKVSAVDRLAVEIEGSGDVRYHGDPALTRRVDGSGDLQQG